MAGKDTRETKMTLSKGTRKGLKSRGGCCTCKVRHIKCDEEKPICLRCKNAGFTCEGYGYQDTPRNAPEVPFLFTSGSSSCRTAVDSRYFGYFLQNALFGLMGFNHQSDFWSRMVLQFSELSPAVLYAVLALSALHEAVYIEGKEIVFAERNTAILRRYNKSITLLRSEHSTQPVQITLICCILFICLENMGGNFAIALEHLKNGLKILQDWHAQECKSAGEEQAREEITRVFRRLDMQATLFWDSRLPQINPTSFATHVKEAQSESFSSLEEAQIALEILETGLFYALTVKSSPDIPSYSPENELFPARKQLLRELYGRFERWKAAFDVLSDRERNNMQTRDLQRGVMLALHHQSAFLLLVLNSNPSGEDNDAKFMKINDMSHSLIKSATKGTFSADIGVVAPLYFSAMNAKSASVRQRAIDLLRKAKSKEGFFSPQAIAGIAEKVSHVKESGSDSGAVTGGIPSLATAHSVPCF